MNEIVVKKQNGITATLTNQKYSAFYNELRFDCEIDGQTTNSKFDHTNNLIKFSKKIKIKKFGNCEGIKLENDEVMVIWNDFQTSKMNYVGECIQRLISGDLLISFSIVGCDYPKYQATIITDETIVNYHTNVEIMAKAISHFYKGYFSSATNLLEKALNTYSKSSILEAGELPDGLVVDYETNPKTIDYHNMRKDVPIMTTFTVKLEALLKNLIDSESKRQSMVDAKIAESNRIIAQASTYSIGKVHHRGDDWYQDLTITYDGVTYNLQAKNIFDFGFIITGTDNQTVKQIAEEITTIGKLIRM